MAMRRSTGTTYLTGRSRAILLARQRRRPDTPRGKRIAVGIVAMALLVTTVAGGLVGLGGMSVLDAMAAGLPDPTELERLTFPEPTVVYDRTGDVELARFQQEGRRVVTYDELPPAVLDTTTTAEDRTFWDNHGFDPNAIIAAAAGNVSGEQERGASTITQQLVRARLLPAEALEPGADRYQRKILEVLQAARVTSAYPGETGKRRIITAYLNQIFYGHGAYGIAAAAKVYFGITNLGDLTIAQAAQLAALPKAPTDYDLYRYVEVDADGRLVVDPSSEPVIRRNWVLTNLASSRWTRLSERELQAALEEPVILAGEPEEHFRAGHFSQQVRRQLVDLLGGMEAVETGGFRVTTTLDWNAQQLAEKWMTAAMIVPNLNQEAATRVLDVLEISAGQRTWINNLRGKDLHDAALVAIDYRTGDVVAYLGSAGYDQDDMASDKFKPKFDAAGDGGRAPGSAFKPIVYAAAFEAGVLTPGSLLLDITTEFGTGWAPTDADQRERGPVLLRKALQYSLNIPAIRAYQRVGGERVADLVEALGIRIRGGRDTILQAGLSAGIGTVEVRPLDLTAAYGAIANGGVAIPPRMILSIRDRAGKVVYEAAEPTGTPAMSPQTAYLVTDILAGNTDRRQNPIWAEALALVGPDGEHRPVAVKTGTTNDATDLATYGFVAPPSDPDAPAYAAGIWVGNADHSAPQTAKPATSLTGAAPFWRAFMADLTRGTEAPNFVMPEGIVSARIDAWTGGRPGGWTKDTVKELFRVGTEPGADGAVDKAGLLYVKECGGWRVDPRRAELGPERWLEDVADWLRRARRGVGVMGQYDSRTAYFWGRSSWGGPLAGAECKPKDKDPGPGDGGGGGGGGGGKPPKPSPTPPPPP